ncbi:hypothetical protein PUN28_014137 [Cardiocondyla obscurior]|uniref:Uncharacterized protein n=1 Tax=Cardiocondyla obscurior TaxID=286306 RepID=A0AAW2EYI2_9HYME
MKNVHRAVHKFCDNTRELKKTFLKKTFRRLFYILYDNYLKIHGLHRVEMSFPCYKYLRRKRKRKRGRERGKEKKKKKKKTFA